MQRDTATIPVSRTGARLVIVINARTGGLRGLPEEKLSVSSMSNRLQVNGDIRLRHTHAVFCQRCKAMATGGRYVRS
jgi:hypothetical protein